MTITQDSSGTSAAWRSTETEGSKKGSPGGLLLAVALLLLRAVALPLLGASSDAVSVSEGGVTVWSRGKFMPGRHPGVSAGRITRKGANEALTFTLGSGSRTFMGDVAAVAGADGATFAHRRVSRQLKLDDAGCAVPVALQEKIANHREVFQPPASPSAQPAWLRTITAWRAACREQIKYNGARDRLQATFIAGLRSSR